MYVRDYMTDKVTAVGSKVDLAEAMGMMAKRRIRRLPVLEGGKLVGIVTKSDLYAALGPIERAEEYETHGRAPVSDAMTPNPATVKPEEPIEAAAALMYRKRISGLPVVDEGKLVGIITETDVFRALIEMLGFAEKGARIQFELDKPENLLTQIQKKSANLVIRGLVCYHDPRADKWHVLMKLRGREGQ